MISRRGFFGLLAGAVAVEIAKPKLYVFAPQGGWNNRVDFLNPRNWVRTPTSPLGFYDGMSLDFYPSNGGIKRGSAQISYVDLTTKTIWFTTPIPSMVKANDYILMQGSQNPSIKPFMESDGAGIIDIIEAVA